MGEGADDSCQLALLGGYAPVPGPLAPTFLQRFLQGSLR
ncbi:hypothetical protein SCE1572_20105 [Sorangium cellulosum So0157-2]|uniref:Uncharacterized protein n=1 Tax=Sorangium cellulosum So0157-2 TaxID=1254432 RepID=S4XVS8_SORCE|nr:hypothetical protein SCE1572_20105 [Sorangium cellulosum So0157-2]